MRSISDQGSHQMVKFVVKNLGYVMVVNSVVLAVLWILRNLHLFTPILMYEVVFIPRSRYRQEGKVRITIGLTLLIAAIILHFSMV